MSGGPLARLVMLGLLAAALTSCATTSGTPRQQMHEWASDSSYTADNTQIESDLRSIATAQRERELLALRTVCDGFGSDVQTLYGELPAPDETLTNELNVALENDFENAAVQCYEAASFSDAHYRRFESELAAGRRAYQRAQRRLASFGVG